MSEYTTLPHLRLEYLAIYHVPESLFGLFIMPAMLVMRLLRSLTHPFDLQSDEDDIFYLHHVCVREICD